MTSFLYHQADQVIYLIRLVSSDELCGCTSERVM